jgi:hypothetical protein
MEEIINNIRFIKYENFWQAKLMFNSQEITFEVYQENLDDLKIQEILSKLDTQILELYHQSFPILTALSCAYWREIKACSFKFTGFSIGLHQTNLFTDFRLCFTLFGEDNFTDYANWMVDIKDNRITGCRREEW